MVIPMNTMQNELTNIVRWYPLLKGGLFSFHNSNILVFNFHYSNISIFII
jgi:hypothetical protein